MPERRAFSSAIILAFGLAFAATAAFRAPAAAQKDTGTIRGAVVEREVGRALNGAQVFVPGTGFGALTDEDGRFLLLNVPVGEVTL